MKNWSLDVFQIMDCERDTLGKSHRRSCPVLIQRGTTIGLLKGSMGRVSFSEKSTFCPEDGRCIPSCSTVIVTKGTALEKQQCKHARRGNASTSALPLLDFLATKYLARTDFHWKRRIMLSSSIMV